MHASLELKHRSIIVLILTKHNSTVSVFRPIQILSELRRISIHASASSNSMKEFPTFWFYRPKLILSCMLQSLCSEYAIGRWITDIYFLTATHEVNSTSTSQTTLEQLFALTQQAMILVQLIHL